MVINLDEKKIVGLLYKLDNGKVICYNFNENGELFCITDPKKAETQKKRLSDREMMDAVADNKIINSNKIIHSINNANKIISLDKEGKLNEIAKEHQKEIAKKLESKMEDAEEQLDLATCERSLERIEEDIVSIIRTGNDEKLKEKIESYRYYQKLRNDCIDKMWDDKMEN